MTEYTPEWFARREAELDARMAALTTADRAQAERTDESLQRLVDSLDETIRALNNR